jgi:hypothetical protein
VNYKQRNTQIFDFLKGRTIENFAVNYKEESLHIMFTDGVVFSLWVDDDTKLCLDVDREAGH